MFQSPLFDIAEYEHMGKPILLSQRDIEEGKGLIRVFDENGNQKKGLYGRVGRNCVFQPGHKYHVDISRLT